MKKVILVDGNNLMFRSYYATAYNGNFMKNSKGFPTNALFGFTNMINKIILEEKPEYMIVAFDKGKTFRHESYADYKGGRQETPNELKMQFPVAKDLLDAMGIKYYEIDNYEADDIIGTFAKFCDDNKDFIGTIISSDKDLLQLISDDVDIKLLKQHDYIRYNKESFIEDYGIEPIRVIDLKALQGDASDNIPGVKGIGEKTALKLLHEYKTLDGIYEHIDELSNSVRYKLEKDKDNAYRSYELATIVKDVKMDITIDDTKYLGNQHKKLTSLYEDLEFYSFLKKEKSQREPRKQVDVKIINSIDELNITKDSAFFLETYLGNYHKTKVLGLAIYNDNEVCFIKTDLLKDAFKKVSSYLDYTYDLKRAYVVLKWLGLDLKQVKFDTMIAASLLDYNIKDDIAYLSSQFEDDIPFYDNFYGKIGKEKEVDIDKVAYYAASKARFIYESMHVLKEKLNKDNMMELFETIEMPLSITLGNMEYEGVNIEQEELDKMGKELLVKIDTITKNIYELAGTTFNIVSPKELGVVLFENLKLPHGKKTARGYSTAIDVLNKLKSVHPIIDLIIEYRMVTKLYTTYIEGLKNSIMHDGKIHTIYTQVLTRTGRLSSIEPNLQNIPTRNEYGKMIRKAFVPSENSVILSSDYSQIELRIFTHMAHVETLIDAFKKDYDIHTKTASDIFHVGKENVTKEMRRVAKAVNFGILYGISSYGLSENLGISVGEAKKFIDNYFESYPGIHEYMNESIKKARRDGYVTTLLGRKRTISELSNSNYMIRQQGERMALNTPIQGTSADIIKKAMVEVEKYFKKHNFQSKMILQVHDELIIDCKKDELEDVKRVLTDIMENTYKLDVPLKVDINYGNNWYDAK